MNFYALSKLEGENAIRALLPEGHLILRTAWLYGPDPSRRNFVLRLIDHLYRLEKTWDAAGLTGPALRARLRQSEFGLTLKLLKRTAAHLLDLVRPKSQLGQA